jgi:uncharacterized protein (TIGR02217 family)
MGYWLAGEADQARWSTIERFDPLYWTIDFPRPMMACASLVDHSSITVALNFATRRDLAGLIWWSRDQHSHPLLRYAASRDYRGLVLSFRWESSERLMPLDAVNGPTLTIEGRDAAGQPRSWYVRLWNYAQGAPTNAQVTLDFDDLDGGFLLPSEADPVYAGDIDRLFISLVSDVYDPASTAPIAAAPVPARVTLYDVRCTGPSSNIAIGDARLPGQQLRIAGGYDDVYNLVPERVVRSLFALGYRGRIDHYVGMSHYPALVWIGAESRFVAKSGVDTICAPAREWHLRFFQALKRFGFDVIISVSMELLDSLAPQDWKQRAHDGTPALTGWQPPSTLLSPVQADAVQFLKQTVRDLMALAAVEGLDPDFQFGEPWWWCPEGPVRKPCFYDGATTSLYLAETGQAAPLITDATQVPDATRIAYASWLGDKLADLSAALCVQARQVVPGCERLLLLYAPQILGDASAVLLPANVPPGWASPAFDALQYEDYDFVLAGDISRHQQGLALLQQRLGYASDRTDYFSGFVLSAGAPESWARIMAFAARRRDLRHVYIWAYPQIARDGLVSFDAEDDVTGFHDVLFPIEIGLRARGGPRFSTTITESASGHESRNINWSQARRVYDAAPGIRSQADLKTLLQFFEARQGRAFAFRYRDPLDDGSAASGDAVSPQDQQIGIGDGLQTSFPLVKHYGAQQRRISHPVAGTVMVAVEGAPQAQGWALGDGGIINFVQAPVAGAVVTAGFRFDVPVRFGDDALELSLASYQAGDIGNVALIEVRDR